MNARALILAIAVSSAAAAAVPVAAGQPDDAKRPVDARADVTASAELKVQEVDWRDRLRSAQKVSQVEGTAAAVDAYQQVIDAAPTAELKAQALVDVGLLLERRPADTAATADLDAAAARYAEAFELSTGTLRLQAANNLAANRLRAGEPEAAVEVMDRAWQDGAVDELEPGARSRCLFNYGRAVEEARDRDRALALYRRAFDADPEFEPAARAIARLAVTSPSESAGIPELVELSDGLLAAGDFDLAARVLRDGITVGHWRVHREYTQLVAELLRYLTAVRPAPERFEREWSDTFAQAGGDPRLGLVDDAYSGRLELVLDPGEANTVYRGWPEEIRRQAVSPFLKMVGDHFFRRGDLREALDLYGTAWALDPTNMEAGLYLANVLAAGADDDPVFQRALDEFLFWAFNEKGAAYLGRDWDAILKFHTVLGTLFSRLQRWGPESDARTALFQWQHALNAHRRLAESRGDEAPPVPGVHRNLAVAYRATGDDAEAWRHAVEAAEAFLDLGRADEAEATLAVLDGAPPPDDPRLRRRVAVLHRALAQIGAGGG